MSETGKAGAASDDPKPPAAREDANRQFADALAVHRAGRRDEAEAAYRRLLDTHPDHAPALANLAVLCSEAGHLPEAVANARKAVDLAPRQAAYRVNLAGFLVETGDTAAAIVVLETGVGADPDDRLLNLNLGVLLRSAARPAEAIVPLEKVLAGEPENLTALDAITDAYAKSGRLTDAVAAGRRVLAAKDRVACTGPPPIDLPARRATDGPATAGPAAGRTLNVIALSLWGTDRRYVEGALANAALAQQIYPGWEVRVYCDDSVGPAARRALTQAGASIVPLPREPVRRLGLFWRFRVANDPRVDRFVCRDCDSRLTVQERVAVDAWIASGKSFHIMRDLVTHTELILAGLWGGRGGWLPDMAEAARRFVSGRVATRIVDQEFLRLVIWPLIKDDVLIHDRCFDLFGAVPFPALGRLPDGYHVGQDVYRAGQFDALSRWARDALARSEAAGAGPPASRRPAFNRTRRRPGTAG